MKKITFLSALVVSIMLFALNANATTIIKGTTTSGFGSTSGIGTVVSGSIVPGGDEKVYGYFIPIDNAVPSGTYGVGGYGLSADTFTTSTGNPIDGNLMHVYFHFNNTSGATANTLTVNFSDMDMSHYLGSPVNDPGGFFEELTVFGMFNADGSSSNSGIQTGGPFTSWDDFGSFPNISVVDITPPVGNNDFGLVFSNLTIQQGNSWLHLGVRAYSDSTLPNARWRNTTELFSATITNEPVPEPATIALLGIGIVGLAGAAARRKLRKSQNK